MNIEMDATDRTGCKAFCGLRYRDFETTDGVCRAGAEAAYDSWLENVGIQALDEPGDGFDRHVWCSDHCRDARLPPIAAPQSKIEVKATVDGKCPLCGVAVPSTHIHLCSPKHVERRKGQRYKGPIGEVYVLSFFGTERWYADCGEIKGVPMPREDQPDLWGDYTLLATAEPGKCEPWCGYGLPPDDVCGYGFIDGPGDEREYFKLPGKSQRRKGYVFSWCSNECREKAIAPNAKAPPAQEAPKAAPVCGSCGKSRATVAMRFVAEVGAQYPWCEPCYLGVEMQYSARTANATGTPYKGPERLRNVLARDEGIESSCWPESDR